ncbi:MAG: homoserine dehydrogenase [Fretibacterium sp.]|nr:homoserine dehydrogenase [Fretibacterium sp.]
MTARLRVGIVGYGRVGKALAELLEAKRASLAAEGLELTLTCVLTSRGGLFAPDGLDCGRLSELARRGEPLESVHGFDRSLNFEVLLSRKAFDLLAEFTPTNRFTGEPGLSHIRSALKNGLHVVTGNKGPFLVAWDELFSLASASTSGRPLLLGIGCTAGGALPSLLNAREALAGSEVLLVEGVLNGTTNFILSRMERGASFSEALIEAQKDGVAETDPSADVEGWDTAAKLVIVANAAMHTHLRLQDLSVTGIQNVSPAEVRRALEGGGRLRLIGEARREGNGVRASVAPRTLDASHPFRWLSDKNKAVRYLSDTLGELVILGGASSPVSAAASALRDIVNARRSGLF